MPNFVNFPEFVKLLCPQSEDIMLIPRTRKGLWSNFYDIYFKVICLTFQRSISQVAVAIVDVDIVVILTNIGEVDVEYEVHFAVVDGGLVIKIMWGYVQLSFVYRYEQIKF